MTIYHDCPQQGSYPRADVLPEGVTVVTGRWQCPECSAVYVVTLYRGGSSAGKCVRGPSRKWQRNATSRIAILGELDVHLAERTQL